MMQRSLKRSLLTVPISLILIISSTTQAKPSPNLEIMSPEGVVAEEHGVIPGLSGVSPLSDPKLELVLPEPEATYAIQALTVGHTESGGAAYAAGASTNTATISSSTGLGAEAGYLSLNPTTHTGAVVVAGGGASFSELQASGTGGDAGSITWGEEIIGSVGQAVTQEGPYDPEVALAELMQGLVDQPLTVE